jgi:uncharacterized protein (TIGR03663 family)
MKRAIIIACWAGLVAAGAFLRFDDLAARPFHADEATGARIAARRMDSGGAAFDPKHYHGPLLADLAIPLCRARGEKGWRDMTKGALRMIPAAAGTLLVLLPLLGRRRFGDPPMLLAAAFLATSPLLVYYSRMFIHEPLLALFGMALLFSPCGRARARGAPGILLGLMYATKESCAISVIAWAGAGAILALENQKSIERTALRRCVLPAALSAGAFILTAGLFYTDGLAHPRGAIDALRTFFVYETVEGHDKPFGWYFQLLALPMKSAGIWWFGTPVLLLALLAYASTFRGNHPSGSRGFIRFLAYSAAGHFLIYGLIAYKTPWLACLPWAHVCLLAGFAFAGQGGIARAALTALAVFGIFTQFQQARAAGGRLASDERNPFAYVPTRPDIERLETWLGEVRKAAPAGMLEPVAVTGSGYWPLPWYLRAFENTGYWSEPPPDLAEFPLVFSMPETADAVTRALAKTHVWLPRGLRAGVPLHVFVRNDVWELWMETGSR